MYIPGDKVNLRPITEDDYEKLVSWVNIPKVAQFSEGEYPTTLQQCCEWHKKAKSNRYQEKLAIWLRDKLIGDIELDHITWRSGDAELRIRVGETELWDRGYGTDAVTSLVKHAFFTMNLSRIYLKVYADNHRAIRCYKKAGFKMEGRLRRNNENNFREIILMRVLKQEFVRKNYPLGNIG